MPIEPNLLRFVRGLSAGAVAQRSGDIFAQPDGRCAGVAEVHQLASRGAVSANGVECRSNGETSGWLRRQLLASADFGEQHRLLSREPGGTVVNLAESPLARLANSSGSEAAYLQRHHVEAGERVRRLAERAQLTPRLTMSYSAAHTAGGSSTHRAEISDLAADARRLLGDIHRVLPRDCAGVVLDVCGLLKGLQQVEQERGWPRRSAKLVLRIGLDRLAEHFGISAFALGIASGKPRRWIDEGARPERFE
jgi:hypothetical protein